MANCFTDIMKESVYKKRADSTTDTTQNPNTTNCTQQTEHEDYDTFSLHHSALCTAFHDQLQTHPYIDYYQLQQPSISSCMEFKTKSSCTAARNSCIKNAYDKASNCLTPGTPSCVATQQATQYSELIIDCFTPVMDTLKNHCASRHQDVLYEQLYELVHNSHKRLLQAFEAELLNSGDYYKMYDINYFYNQAEIEEHDYRICDDSEPVFKLFETIFTRHIEYTFSPFESISEIEKDLNDYLYTFSNAAHSEYVRYVNKIENILQGIQASESSKNETESLWDYVRRVCTC